MPFIATPPVSDPILALGAVALRDRLASGEVTALAYTEACLARIAAEEDRVQAWAWFDPDHARDQARALDAVRAAGGPIGPLHGLPIGLKDVIDTAGIPTENGTPIDAGRVPAVDAVLVARLRAAGAIIMGKTVSTEVAYLHPGKTRNPVNPAHTPGGSSSGSAAAVAAGMVPLAVGTQTGGSVIRPAAFCGIVGVKPTFGRIPRGGVLLQSHTLDTLGVFARSVEDAALICDVLMGHDPADPSTAPLPPPRLLATVRDAAPKDPTFAFVRLPTHAQADPQMRAAVEGLAQRLGHLCAAVPLPVMFDQAAAQRQRINFAEMAHYYAAMQARGRDLMSPIFCAAMDEGAAVRARDYLAAVAAREDLNAALDDILAHHDAILTAATLGPAPLGLGSTGSSIFNGVFTFTGSPAVTIPLFRADNGLPMGVQLVGRRGEDARMLRIAQWLAHHAPDLGARPQPA